MSTATAPTKTWMPATGEAPRYEVDVERDFDVAPRCQCWNDHTDENLGRTVRDTDDSVACACPATWRVSAENPCMSCNPERARTVLLLCDDCLETWMDNEALDVVVLGRLWCAPESSDG